VPSWVLPAIILGYAGAVVLLALAAAFSHDIDRRESAYNVLRILLPWGIILALYDARVRQPGDAG